MFDVFYLDRPTGLFPHECKAESIEDAVSRSKTRSCWIVNYLCDYTGFDFLFQPLPHQLNQSHVWPSQHQENSGTWLVPKISNTDGINRDHSVVPRISSVPRLHIKHNHIDVDIDVAASDYTTRYISDYLGTMRRALHKVDWEYCWVTADVCDYSDFDFTWHPSEWQQDMLHVFPSQDQKFGDTFYVHVPSFLKKSENLKLLEWFDTIHFVEKITVKRKSVPVVVHKHDTHVQAVWEHEFKDPVVQFTTGQIVDSPPTINLWRTEMKTVVPLSIGASVAIIPREAKNSIKTQLYDYPYIDKTHNHHDLDHAMDVIFISNGEPMAEENWKNLLSIYPRAKHSQGVTGREAAYKAAARLSNTPWFYAVFAKTEVLSSFKFNFQPDRLQAPKHYIFHSRNPLNGLEYGAMNINLYNRQLVLDTIPGIDFTLSAAHEVVSICASISRFNTDPWITWRSAFREVLKLKQEVDLGADVEIQYRLKVWCEKAVGENAEFCLAGSNDALEYYDQVSGNNDALRLSFDWEWLQNYYYKKYNQKPWL